MSGTAAGDRLRRNVSFMREQHEAICYEQGDHKDECDTVYSLAADAMEQLPAAIARAEAAEADLQRRLDAEWNAGIDAAENFLNEQAVAKGNTKTPQGRTAIFYARKIRTLRRPTND